MKKLPWVVIVAIMGIVLSHTCMVTQADEGTDSEPERDNGLFRLGLYANATTATVKPPLGQYSFSVQVVDESLFAAFGWTHRRVELEIIDITGSNWVYGLSNTRFFLAHNEVRSINLTAGAGPNASFFSTCTLHAQMLDEPIGNSWHHEYLTFSLMVAPFHALSLELEKRVFEKGQDEFFQVPLTIKNEGNHEDIFSLDVTYLPQGWHYSFSSQTGFVQPKSTKEESLYLYIPHDKVYIRQETHLVKIVLKSQFDSGIDQDTRFVIVTVQGFHFTQLQQVGVFASIPVSLLLLGFVVLAYRSRDPYSIIPKPWSEEKPYLETLDEDLRGREKGLMKEEWQSALLSRKSKKKWEDGVRGIAKRKRVLQRNLDEKIEKEWEKTWIDPTREWKDRCEKIKKRYKHELERLHRQHRKATADLEKAYRGMNRQREKKGLVPLPIPPIRQPEGFDLHLPPPPQKTLKPTVPRYRYDRENNRIIEPPQEAIEAIIDSLKKRRGIGKVQVEKIREICHVKDEEVSVKLDALQERLQNDITRAEQRLEIDREREDLRVSKEKELEKVRKQLEKESRKVDQEREDLRVSKEKELEKVRKQLEKESSRKP